MEVNHVIDAPMEIGWGHVPMSAEEFTKRLEVGVSYQVLTSTKDKNDWIVLVKQDGSSGVYAIRVKTLPPKHFTLVNGGNPIAITETPSVK